MNRIPLLMIIILAGHSADVGYPTAIGPGDSLQIAGAAPTTNTVGSVKIGGGLIRATALICTDSIFMGGNAVIGADPGGSELMRVGGVAKFYTPLGTRPGGVDTPRLVQTWQAAGTYNHSYMTRWDVLVGNNGANTSTGQVRERNKLIFQSRTEADFGESSTNAFELRGDGSATFSGELVVSGAAPANVGVGEVRLGGGNLLASGSGTFLGDLTVGNAVPGQNHKLVLRGPNSPYDVTSHQSISYEFHSAGSAKIRSYRGGSWDTYLQFLTNGVSTGNDNPTVRMHISESGNVGIGTTAPTNTLTVIGTISAKEIKVTTTGADYVFAEGYRLRPLAEVEAFIAERKHLPEMMPAAAMQADGMPVSEVVTKQLAKIEELTLYVIQAQKERDAAMEIAKSTQDQVARLAARLDALEASSKQSAKRP